MDQLGRRGARVGGPILGSDSDGRGKGQELGASPIRAVFSTRCLDSRSFACGSIRLTSPRYAARGHFLIGCCCSCCRVASCTGTRGRARHKPAGRSRPQHHEHPARSPKGSPLRGTCSSMLVGGTWRGGTPLRRSWGQCLRGRCGGLGRFRGAVGAGHGPCGCSPRLVVVHGHACPRGISVRCWRSCGWLRTGRQRVVASC